MQNNVETQHKHMYSLYNGSLCNVAFPMARFTCIMTSQVFVEILMWWSIALSSAFYRGRKHLWIVFSFKVTEIKMKSEAQSSLLYRMKTFNLNFWTFDCMLT